MTTVDKFKNKRFASKYEGFVERLEELKTLKCFITDKEFAEWMSVNPNAYSMIKKSTRPISDSFMDKLIVASERSEEYWLYGTNEESIEYLDKRPEFKALYRAIDACLEFDLMTLDGQYTSEFNERAAKKILNAGLEADLTHILAKKRLK